MKNNNIKSAIFQTTFHGETWFSCPFCNQGFEYFDAKFERGFKKTPEKDIYIHEECGNMLEIK